MYESNVKYKSFAFLNIAYSSDVFIRIFAFTLIEHISIYVVFLWKDRIFRQSLCTLKGHNDKRLFNINDESGIKFRKFRARLSTHEYSISVITLLPQRVIHFGTVSNNFTTFCINKTVAGFSSIYGSFL